MFCSVDMISFSVVQILGGQADTEHTATEPVVRDSFLHVLFFDSCLYMSLQ